MRFFPLVCGLAVLATTALAQSSSNGQMGLQATQDAYCGIKALIGGNVGTLVGLGVAIMGLIKLIRGGGFSAIVLIAVGTCITAVPSLIESALGGLGSFLSSSGISSQSNPTSIKC